MQQKTLSHTNLYLRDRKQARSHLIRSLASSTAIETGESIEAIEKKLIIKYSVRFPVTLA